MKTSLFNEKYTIRYAWGGWLMMFLLSAAIIASGSQRTVVVAYWYSAQDWLAGNCLYNFSGIGGFTYFPQAAILFVPFALLPRVAGEILWRLVDIAVFAAGVRSLAGLAAERSGRGHFPLMSLIAIPLAWDCARNGQSTLIMTGFMLLAIADLAGSRWWRATLWLSLSVAVKPLAVVLVLLVGAVYPPMIGRLAAGMAATALAPFLLQRPGYVLDQYAAFMKNSTIAAHTAVVARGWSSPFNTLRVAGLDVAERVQTVIRLIAAPATLLLCWIARRRHDAARAALFVFSLAVVYLLLFSPRTEGNTYAMMGPAIGAFLLSALLIENRRAEGMLLAGIVLVTVANRPLEHVLGPRGESDWLSPLMGICFAAYVVFRLFTRTERAAGGIADGAPGRR